jgi:hypothetical protein
MPHHIRIALVAAVLLLAPQARSSVVMQRVTLADMVKQSDLIVLAEVAKPPSGIATFKGAPAGFKPLVGRYRSLEVLFRRSKTVLSPSALEVFSTSLEIELGQYLRSKRPPVAGEPNPIFAAPTYVRAGASPQGLPPSRRILFLRYDAVRKILRFTCGDGWELEAARGQVLQLLKVRR